MDPERLTDALDAGSYAPGIPVDIFGQCADYDQIEAMCEENDAPIVQDAVEALGAICDRQPAGRFGAIARLSFKGNKITTPSGGGVLVTVNEE